MDYGSSRTSRSEASDKSPGVHKTSFISGDKAYARFIQSVNTRKPEAWQRRGSMFYNFKDNLSFGLEAQNLTDSAFRQLMQQPIGDKELARFQSGRRFTASLRYSF